MVAPFWADVDTRNGGEVFYRETTDPGLLQQATDDVTATYVDHRNFKAKWLLVATWYEVAFFGARKGPRKKARSSSATMNKSEFSLVFPQSCSTSHE